MDSFPEFDLCDQTFGRITDAKPRQFPLSHHTQPERTVVAVWHFTGVIENSGLGGLISRNVVGDPDFSLVIECFDRINTKPAVDAVRSAVAHIRSQDGSVPDYRKRRERWDTVAESERDRLDRQFFSASDSIVIALASYIHHYGLDRVT